MPKYIISGEQPFVDNRLYSEVLSKLTKQLAEVSQNPIDLHNAAIDYYNNFYSGRPIGQIINEQHAADMLKGFPGDRHKWISVGVLFQFFEAVNNLKIDPTYASSHEIGFRFYMGRDLKSHDYKFVIVPCLALKNIVNPDSHLEDKEKSLFDYNQTFFALTYDGVVSTDLKYCRSLVGDYNYSTEKRVVYYPKQAFADFIFGLGTNQPKFTNLSIHFARTVGIAPSQLTLILRCLDQSNRPITSTIHRSIQATGTTFDEGDLIPPPPPRTTAGNTQALDPWIPDSIIDSTP